LSAFNLESSLQQYVVSQKEKELLAYALNEMTEAGFTRLENESSKYLILTGINMVNCISVARLA